MAIQGKSTDMPRSWHEPGDQSMRNRKRADRAEAIVRGVGTLIMLLVLLIMVNSVLMSSWRTR
jgi:hypothetical protein